MFSHLSVYDIHCTDLSGKPLQLQQYKGRPLIIVNTASLCGYSNQFNELQSLWKTYKDDGLTILGVPSNDFGKQEPGNSAQIASLCLVKFGVSFPMLEKTSVRGPLAHPLFKWLAEEGGYWSVPRWNF